MRNNPLAVVDCGCALFTTPPNGLLLGACANAFNVCLMGVVSGSISGTRTDAFFADMSQFTGSIVATIAQSALISLDSQFSIAVIFQRINVLTSIPKLIQEAQVPTTQDAKQVELILSNRCLVQHRTPN